MPWQRNTVAAQDGGNHQAKAVRNGEERRWQRQAVESTRQRQCLSDEMAVGSTRQMEAQGSCLNEERRWQAHEGKGKHKVKAVSYLKPLLRRLARPSQRRTAPPPPPPRCNPQTNTRRTLPQSRMIVHVFCMDCDHLPAATAAARSTGRGCCGEGVTGACCASCGERRTALRHRARTRQ